MRNKWRAFRDNGEARPPYGHKRAFCVLVRLSRMAQKMGWAAITGGTPEQLSEAMALCREAADYGSALGQQACRRREYAMRDRIYEYAVGAGRVWCELEMARRRRNADNAQAEGRMV